MAVGVDYKTLVNARSVGSELVVSDFFDIPGPPGAGLTTYRTIELPLNVVTPPSLTDQFVVREVHPITHVPTGPVYTKVVAPTTPLPGQYQVDNVDTFTFGRIKFNNLDGGKTVEIIYTGRGSLVFAEDVNDPRDELEDSRDTESDLGTRLGLIEDGSRILPGAIRPVHISTILTDDFTFPRHVTVGGDLNIVGVINKTITEILTSSDEIFTLNADFTGTPSADCGMRVERGLSADVDILWKEADDRWAFSGGGLYLPDGDLELNGNEIKRATFEYVGSGASETALVGTAFDGQLIYRTDIKTPRFYDSAAGVFKSFGVAVYREDFTVGTPSGSYTGSQTVFDLGFTYNVGSKQLLVYSAGLLMREGASFDYLETDNNTITFNTNRLIGSNVSIVNLSVAV